MEGEGVVCGDGRRDKSKELRCVSNEIQVKSYCEVAKLASLVRGFDDAKRELVRSIGFDGLLKTPMIDALDDNFSIWLMTCLDAKTMVLTTPNGERLPMTDVDAHFVLGIPFRGENVSHDARNDRKVVSNVLGKLTIAEQPASLSLEYLEWVLRRNYGEKLNEQEKVAFQIAVVLYSVACFLVGPVPKKGFPLWLLKNFVGPTKISKYNWCGYVLSGLAHGALQVQEQLRNGDAEIKLHGCTFLLQILYLDNVDFGPFSAVHFDIPRGNVYNNKYLKHLIDLDRKESMANGIVQYGIHKLRVAAEVCYSRGWEEPNYGEWIQYDKNYMTASELLQNILLHHEKIAVMFAGLLCRISASESYQIRSTYKTWYPGYKAIFTGLPAGTFSTTGSSKLKAADGAYGRDTMEQDSLKTDGKASKRQKIEISKQDICGGSDLGYKSALEMLAEEAVKQQCSELLGTVTDHVKEFVREDGFEKRVVAAHSKFPKSPFELGRFMHTVTWRKKMALLDWLERGVEDWGYLTRVWVQLDYPGPVSLLGYDLKTQLSANGSFTTTMVDAITRTSIQFDEIAYGATGSRWRHFLPARFAEVVLREEDFLGSEEIRAHFTGGHIDYPVENCRVFSAPVYYHGRWSCYFWDFQKKRVIVLDPTRMGLNTTNVEMHHGHLVQKMTKALFACIGRFFAGWNFEERNWRELYPTHHGPRSKIYNSGLYSILYSRYFDGQQLVCTPNQGGLVEPRSSLLYELLTVQGNQVKLPARFQEIVSQPWLLKHLRN